jgi:integrative and conjugative element protein (TIGR02256 family)
MFGFLTRLEQWFRQGAVGQLDPVGAPLHPPVAYASGDRMVIPRADTPAVGEQAWHGLARLNVVSDRRVDVVGWSELFSGDGSGPAAAAILLPAAMPFEYPKTIAGLLDELERRGVPRQLLLLTLQAAVVQNEDGSPLYVLVGAPMRGVQGAESRRQHLSAWYIDSVIAHGLRLAIRKYSEHEALREIGAEVEQIIWDWAAAAEVTWCVVREQRAEIVTRRDHDTPTAWFKGRTVALWGCGALGGHIAEFLARAGVSKLILRDQGRVAPGLLVRQPYDDAEIGELKATALAERLRRINPALEIDVKTGNLIHDPLDAQDLTDGADVIVETTGSRSVLKKIELRFQEVGARRVPIASLVIGPHAQRAFAVIVQPEHSGGPADVARKALLAACDDPQLAKWREEFLPATGRDNAALFQPEPGCSDPTFVGSATDVAVLAGSMLNCIASDLSGHRCSASAHFLLQPHLQERALSGAARAALEWQADRVLRDRCADYEVRLSDGAWRSMLGEIDSSRSRRGARVETGGLLFGQRDDAARVIWVSDASGPPPDSRASAYGFVCGVEGTRQMNEEKRTRSRGSVQFIGMWHTHPGIAPEPSRVDLRGMAQIVTSVDPPIARALLMIVGHTPERPTPAAYLFRRQDIQVVEYTVRIPRPSASVWARTRNWIRRLTSRTRFDVDSLHDLSNTRSAENRQSD